MNPIQPTITQMKRMKAAQTGEGFLMYKMSDGRVEVVQFVLDLQTGELTKNDGNSLVFWTDQNYSVGYKLEKVTGQARMFEK